MPLQVIIVIYYHQFLNFLNNNELFIFGVLRAVVITACAYCDVNAHRRYEGVSVREDVQIVLSTAYSPS